MEAPISSERKCEKRSQTTWFNALCASSRAMCWHPRGVLKLGTNSCSKKVSNGLVKHAWPVHKNNRNLLTTAAKQISKSMHSFASCYSLSCDPLTSSRVGLQGRHHHRLLVLAHRRHHLTARLLHRPLHLQAFPTHEFETRRTHQHVSTISACCRTPRGQADLCSDLALVLGFEPPTPTILKTWCRYDS